MDIPGPDFFSAICARKCATWSRPTAIKPWSVNPDTTLKCDRMLGINKRDASDPSKVRSGGGGAFVKIRRTAEIRPTKEGFRKEKSTFSGSSRLKSWQRISTVAHRSRSKDVIEVRRAIVETFIVRTAQISGSASAGSP
jgi:hypothetical protein